MLGGLLTHTDTPPLVCSLVVPFDGNASIAP